MSSRLDAMLKKILRSSLLRSSAVYTTSSVVNAAIPFLVMPILTRYMTPTDYGIVSMMTVLVGLVSPFVGLNIHGAISVKYFDRTPHNLPRYIGNCFLLLFGSTLILSLLLWLFAGPISSLTAFPRQWLAVVILLSIGQFVTIVLLTLWQVRDNPYRYASFQILQTVMNVTLTLILVVAMHMDWRGRVLAQVISGIVVTAAGLVLLWRGGWIKLDYNLADMRHALKFGVPLIPHALGAILITQTDRIFITKMVGIADTGIYTVGFQLGMIIELLASSFNKAYVPWLYRRLGGIDLAGKQEIVKLTYLYFCGILLLALFLSLVAPWFLSFFVGKDFAGSARYTPWIALGFAFSGMYYMVANYVFYAGATHILAWVTLLTAAVNIVMNYVLIKINGAVGAAQASALAFFISFILTWALSSKVYPMPWRLRRRAV